MIENIPFLHTMAYSIAASIANEGGPDAAVIPTVLIAYTLSTLLVAATFWLMGALRMGSMVIR